MTGSDHRLRTLVLAIVLHAFTHVYQVALVPLYLPIRDSLKLASVGQATLLVTVMYIAYFLPSYPIGILADRFSRKKLLTFGLALNAAGFVGLALAPNYPIALISVILAGCGGSCFHPAATALIARLFPGSTGRALGFVGIGASVGFFIGPLYAGWRAEATGNWQTPVLELGVAGLAASVLFAWLAVEERALPFEQPTATRRRAEPMFPTRARWLMFLAAAFAFSLRDFSGSSMGTLSSLFLQNARGFDVKHTGFAIGFIFIASAISNPLFGHFSDRARLRWAGAMLALAAVFVAVFPYVPRAMIVPTLLLYGFFFMANFPIVEAALMEAVPDAVRGRVFGLFITIGGLLGNLSHWLVGYRVESLGGRATEIPTYFPLYLIVALLMVLSLLGLPGLRAIRRRETELAAHPPPPPVLRSPR